MAEFRIPLNYEEKVKKAAHNLSCVKRTTLHPGTLIPLYARRMKRGEKFVFSTPQLLLQSQPTYAPVMGSYRLRVEWYFNSDSNHYGWIDNDTRLSTSEVLNRRHHTFVPSVVSLETLIEDNGDTEFGGIDPRSFLLQHGNQHGSLLDFMGVSPCWIPAKPADTEFNLDFILTYLNIIRCYHVNQQFPDIPYISGWFGDDFDPTETFKNYSLDWLDDLFMFLRYCDNGVTFGVDVTFDVPEKYHYSISRFEHYLSCVHLKNGGLFLSQYQPDLYRNLLNKDMDLIKSNVQVNSDGTFSIDTFRFDNRVQLMLDRINPFGGKDSTLSRTLWGVKSHKEYDIPELINVQTEFIDTNAITSSNAGQTTIEGRENIVPGDLSGNVNQRKFPKGKQAFTANVPGTLMAIVSVVPLVDYCQNIDHWLLLNNFSDEYTPQMAQRGFEDVPLSDYCAIPLLDGALGSQVSYVTASIPNYKSVVGKQICWIHDMTAVNRSHGEFASFGDFETWVLNRRYTKIRSSAESSSCVDQRMIYEISPYVNPLDWQYPFVAQSLADPNWYLQCQFDVKSISPVGYRFMPTLE